MSRFQTPAFCRGASRRLVPALVPALAPFLVTARSIALALAACALCAAAYAPAAQARSSHHQHHHRASFIVAGAYTGLYYYPSGYFRASSYYPAYFPLDYPLPAYAPPPAVSYIEPPSGAAAPAPAAPALTGEQREQRLQDMCRQGFFTRDECTGRREELLKRM